VDLDVEQAVSCVAKVSLSKRVKPHLTSGRYAKPVLLGYANKNGKLAQMQNTIQKDSFQILFNNKKDCNSCNSSILYYYDLMDIMLSSRTT